MSMSSTTTTTTTTTPMNTAAPAVKLEFASVEAATLKAAARTSHRRGAP